MESTDRQIWHQRLRACDSLAAVCAVLSEAAGVLTGARASGVFLVERSGSQLLLYASWQAGEAPQYCHPHAASASLPVHGQDPLNFALQTGKVCQVSLGESTEMLPCQSLLPALASGTHVLALPLLALKNACIGGVVLALDSAAPACLKDISALCDMGALLLEVHIYRQRHGSPMPDPRVPEGATEEGHTAKVTEIFVGQGEAARRVREQIVRAAAAEVPVLITGETGTGKELAATALHAQSPRRHAPFVRINCAALPAHLLESELYGHSKGAFSGADREHVGLLRSAEGGTVLLDEIGEIPIHIQIKLLRVLQDHEVRPVGSVHSHAVNIRIIASTNKNMDNALQEGLFRQDLYHRLAGVHIHVPPLRERREDMPLLAEHFLEQAQQKHQRPGLNFSPECLRLLCAASFPGNARQLRNVIHTAVIMAPREATELLPSMLLLGVSASQFSRESNASGLMLAMRDFESNFIKSVLGHCQGNIAEAARALCLPRSTLVSKMKKLHIEMEEAQVQMS